MNSATKERILVTVKTYPTLSKKYGELVCTAGLREDGSWVRIYPVPFRGLSEAEQYRKYDWVECDLARNHSDFRPESFRPINGGGFRSVGHIDTANEWRERRRVVLGNTQVFDLLDDIIVRAKANEMSLALFKPAAVLDFVVEEDERDWDPVKEADLRRNYSQFSLFEDNEWRRNFRVIPKLPYNFSYRFRDISGRVSELQILDWEIGALYWNCLRLSGGDESAAIAKVRTKYFDEFTTRDLHFFLGTTQQWQLVAPNPWVIVGVFPIPPQQQGSML